jgi:oligopeptide transport system permease protein
MAGAGFLLGVAVVAALTPWLAPYSYAKTDLAYGARPPSSQHPFGTDELGRDLLTRTMWGARVSLAVGILATAVSLAIGVSYGAVAGYLGGRADQLMMRIVDVLYGLPFMFFVIILMVVFGRNIVNLFIALGAVQWLTMARIVRGQILSLKAREFVQAVRALGARPAFILARHLVPNAAGPIIVYATLTVPAMMLEEAFLSFLGLGVQPPMASWGSLASEGAAAMEPYPWLIVFPGIALTLTLFALNFLGDGLRDALDPQVGR